GQDSDLGRGHIQLQTSCLGAEEVHAGPRRPAAQPDRGAILRGGARASTKQLDSSRGYWRRLRAVGAGERDHCRGATLADRRHLGPTVLPGGAGSGIDRALELQVGQRLPAGGSWRSSGRHHRRLQRRGLVARRGVPEAACGRHPRGRLAIRLLKARAEGDWSNFVAEEVSLAYRRLCLRGHPSRGGSPRSYLKLQVAMELVRAFAGEAGPLARGAGDADGYTLNDQALSRELKLTTQEAEEEATKLPKEQLEEMNRALDEYILRQAGTASMMLGDGQLDLAVRPPWPLTHA
ncbi:unnamed protein product, partial [Prorocentrum cordatum]